MPSIPEDELIEKLAAIEHDRWADWQKWVHGMLKVNSAGEYVLPADAIRRWDRQIETPYSELTEKEKQSDRDQVMRYWPLVRQYAAKERANELLSFVAGNRSIYESSVYQVNGPELAERIKQLKKGQE